MDYVYQIIAGGAFAASALGAGLLRARRAAQALSQMIAVPGCCGSAAGKVAPPPPLPPAPAASRTLAQRIALLLDRWDYLRTRREWRYRASWVLLLGEPGAGKTSALASIPPAARLAPDADQAALVVAGTSWQFHPQGVLIDPVGRLPAAPAGTTDARAWSGVLDQIDALRPERPLDGLVLMVSARSLLTATADQRHALALQAAAELKQIQRRFEFVLPVYVTVGDTDAVAGFTAFWRAQAAARQSEIFGWSAPQQADSDTPEAWADSTFDTLGAGLRTLQIEAAAARGDIADADLFFLFPRHFQQLRAPLKAWLGIVFHASAWQAGFLCRGVYFTGSVAAAGEDSGAVRDDVAFVADLIEHKVLAEPHLARPTRRGIWSRNKLIRAVQVLGVLAYCGMLVALGDAMLRLDRQVDALVVSLTRLKAAAPALTEPPCPGREHVVDLLTQVARIDGDTVYAAIPASWFDWRIPRRTARIVTGQALEGVVMPALACKLRQRIQELVMDADAPPPAPSDATTADTFTQSRQALSGYIQSVRALELNLTRFNQLAGVVERPDPATLAHALADLTVYAYGGAPPPLLNGRSALAGLRYTDDLRLPEGMRSAFVGHIDARARRLRTTLDSEIRSGSTLLDALEDENKPILDNTRHFTWWLSWVRKSWLGATPALNPCADIRSQLDADVAGLVDRYPDLYGPHAARLAGLSPQFSEHSCFEPARSTLASMQLAPIGPLFVPSKQGLQIDPGLVREAAGMSALMALNYMQATPTSDFACLPSAPLWQAAQIAQAAGYARVYQAYAKAQGVPVPGAAAAPLYDRLARHQLELAMNSSMAGAQRPAAGGMAGPGAQIGAAGLDDQVLSQQSGAMAATVAPLLEVLQTYKNLGFASRAAVTECARKYASSRLASISTLARASRLYDPEPGPAGGPFYELGDSAATKDYLARQVARGQVLASYAAPFVNLLQGTSGLNDAQARPDQTTAYWTSTIAEVNRYVQFKDPAGQVGLLEELFLKQLADLTADNCRQQLVPVLADHANDLFYVRRKRLSEDAASRCADSRSAQAMSAYRALSLRFNAELAGHYPFGEPTTDDLPLSTVAAFFNDYAAQRTSLRKAVADMKGDHWTEARRFLDQLDAALALFNGTLVGTDTPLPIRLNVTFRAAPGDSPGSEQIANWVLSSGANATGFPNRPTALDWAYGESVVLDLAWANRSVWVPAAAPPQPDLSTEGASASFAAGGNWALLRMIAAHRASSAPASQLDVKQVLLEYLIPVMLAANSPGKQGSSTTRVYLGLKLMAVDPRTKLPVALSMPPRLPTSAP